MTTPAYPFGSDRFGTDIDDTVELRAVRTARLERVKAYEVEAPGIRCETTRLGEVWYVTAVYTSPERRLLGVVSLGVYPDHYTALEVIHFTIDAHEAAGS